MSVELIVRFEGFDANPSGSPGSAKIRFSIWEHVRGETARYLATIPLATPVVDGGIPAMIALAADDLARDFRSMADQAQRIAEAYREQVPASNPRSDDD